jgi:hypothetical protein
MKFSSGKKIRNGGYGLAITLVFMAIMLAVLAGVTRLTAVQSGLTARNNLYNAAVAAAEAATELTIAQMNRDFIKQSVNSDLSVYQSLTPQTVQSNWPIQFSFSDSMGTPAVTGVESLGPAVIANLNSQFEGLYGLVSPYRISSTAKALNAAYEVSATVQQDIQLASIPVFQFAIFYTLDLELNPGADMIVNGKVHSNGDIYTAPQAKLTYKDSVSSVGRIFNNRHADDPQYNNSKQAPTYQKQKAEKVGSLTLPVGTDNNPESVREILKVPDASEDPNSLMGKQRYYNKADLIITTTSTGVQVKSGRWNLFAAIPGDVTNGNTVSYSFVKTSDKTMFDLRENTWVSATEIDVAKFNAWLNKPAGGKGINNAAKYFQGHGINSIYVEDQRDLASRLEAVRIVNGHVLPEDGLTVATERPIYVKGHFNLNNGSSSGDQTVTTQTKPASLVGDSITIISSQYNDANAAHNVKTGRAAENTTVNAALLGGIVKTQKDNSNNKQYSGGAENFIRLLENWSGKTLTYNGSMVVMFESKHATKFWQSPSEDRYYTAPTRKWAFDLNFLDQSKLPPGTPQVRKLVRGNWTLVSKP